VTTVIPDLEVWGVYDRGVPNSERIALKANSHVPLSDFALSLGIAGKNNSLVPAPDHFLWLGRTVMDVGWVIVYTGKGDPIVTTEEHTKEPMQVLYWGKDDVVFTSPAVKVALLRVSQVGMDAGDKNIAEYLARKKKPDANDLLLKWLSENPPAKLSDAQQLLSLLGQNIPDSEDKS
jgi:hypothetical protein